MKNTLLSRIGVTAVGSMVVAGLGGAVAVSAAVAPGHGHLETGAGWTTNAFEATDGGNTLNPQQSDVTGPVRAPFGTGSHRIEIGQSTAQAEMYRTDDFDGVKLADVTRLEFSTFARPTTGDALRQPTALRLAVDTDGDDIRDQKLYFFPANNADQQHVANGEWQTWRATPTTGRFSVDGDQGPAATTTLAEYVAANPGAKLVHEDFANASRGGALALLTGGGLAGPDDAQINGEFFVDRVVVGVADDVTLYDLGTNAETTGPNTPVTVTAEALQGWGLQAFDFDNGNKPLTPSATFVPGPGTAPAGAGSLRFAISDDTTPGRVERLRTEKLDGTLVRDLRTLDFSTFQRGDAGNDVAQMPVLVRANIDTNGDLTDDERLYFFPSNNGEIQQGAWQSWHAADGKWNVNGGDDGPQNAVTLDEFVAAHPDARFVANPAGGPGLAFQVGGGGAAQTNGEYFLDAVTIAGVDAATGAKVSGSAYDLEPAAPVITVGDTSVLEGNDNKAKLRFRVALDGAANQPVTFAYATAPGSAKAGKDFTRVTGELTVPAGKTSTVVVVPVRSDMVREADETMTLRLSAPSYGKLGDARATGTIVNDDTRVDLAVNSPAKGKVRAKVVTVDPAAGAKVKLYVNGQKKPAFSGSLNRLGQVTARLDKKFPAHTKFTVRATVTTAYGTYTSRDVKVTVR